ncbi:MAG: ATP-dependent Clp protease proteolytic subunit, partial [Oscillospiraceae bacterium]|nr:ATP-dependent Clp protease proteolytic subunit [Oscillospiraceae bacterium]
QATDIQIHAENILRTKERLNRILAENTGKPIGEVREACERDNFMTAEEARDFGLIDTVIFKR